MSAAATGAPAAAPGAPSAPVSSSSAQAPPASSTSPTAATKPAASVAQGAIVVTLGDDAAPAARALAREAYSDEALRPRIDDATARVLAGEAPPSAGPAKLAEIAEIRRAAQAGPDAVTRRLLASLGADLGALGVVAVSMRADKPVARVLAVSSGTFMPVELAGTIERQADGSSRVKWTDVPRLLATFLGVSKGAAPAASTPAVPGGEAKAAVSAQPGPLAAKKEEPQRSFWTSPWTWAGIGVVVTAGVVVFALSQANSGSNSNSLHLQGRVDK